MKPTLVLTKKSREENLFKLLFILLTIQLKLLTKNLPYKYSSVAPVLIRESFKNRWTFEICYVINIGRKNVLT